MKPIKKAIEIFKKEGFSGLYAAFKRRLYRTGYSHQLIHYFDGLLVALGGKYVVKDILGSKMILDLSDHGLSRSLYHNGIREAESSRIYMEFTKGVKNVLDVGANIGYFVLLASKGVTGEIYALEPDPRSFKLLQENIKINNLDKKVEAYNVAAGDRSGKASFYQKNSMNLSRIAINREGGLEVTMTTIDDFLNGKEISCLRFDVEGYELSLLRGAKRTLQRKGLKIFMEVHPSLIKEYEGNLSEFLDLIKDFKVKHYVVLSKRGFFRNPPLLPLFAVFFMGKDVIPWNVLNINKTIAEMLKYESLKEMLTKGGVRGTYHLFLEKD